MVQAGTSRGNGHGGENWGSAPLARCRGMKFGRVPLAAAAGGILAHSLHLESGRIAKGTALTWSQVDALQAAGISDVVVARLEPGEMGEDAAAGRVAAAIAGDEVLARKPATGRSNLHAQACGLLEYNVAGLDAMNLVDEAVTIAALPPYAVVEAGQMAATVKIIPYGVREAVIDRIVGIAAGQRFQLRVRPFQPKRVGLIQTFEGEANAHLAEKTRRVTAARLALLGSHISTERMCLHHEQAIAAAITGVLSERSDLVLVVGASATTDRGDVVPAGINCAGGRILHLGMPVEPGNLLVLGETRSHVPILCLPGCARSPALNGIDWVLERLLAGIPVRPADIMRMGAGGLIKGSPSRIPESSRRDGTQRTVAAPPSVPPATVRKV